MSITRLDVNLEQYDVGLSGAVPLRNEWTEPAMDRAILEFVSLFSSIVFKYGGRIVHGCHPALTPVILHQARLHANERWRKPVTLVASDLWAQNWTAEDIDSLTDIAELIVTDRVGTGDASDPSTRNASLTAMRKVLIDSLNVMVAVGGKMHSGDGMVPGIQEEMDFAEAKKIPRFLIGGLGGFASQLARNLMPHELRNSLSTNLNETLFSTTDVGSCVNLVFETLVSSDQLLQSSFQPVRWNPGLQKIVDHRDGGIWEESSRFVLRAWAI